MFFCSACDTQYTKWEGRCRECGRWGTIVETIQNKVEPDYNLALQKFNPKKIIDFSQISHKQTKRLKSGIDEFDRVLGGGVVPGSLILLGGEPGIGKSTLIVQVIVSILKVNSAENSQSVLYVSGEESAEQVGLRVCRLKLSSKGFKFIPETNTESICAAIIQTKPILVVIDSIQTVYSQEVNSQAGTTNQVTASTVKFLKTAKKLNIPIFIIGHITKDGQVAGPKTLEHLVDAVLYLEGDRNHFYRLLRPVKNRFGSTDEVGVFEMQEKGLIEVKNPSQLFMQEAEKDKPGTSAGVIIEGARPFIIEAQALTCKTYFGYPKRTSSGFSKSRLELLIAILTKRAKLNLGNFDIYLNIAGGLKIKEPSVDLTCALAIISSYQDKLWNSKICSFGELGLSGEIRPVSFMEKRINEAKNLGFKKIICPKLKGVKSSGIEIEETENLEQTMRKYFNK